VRRLQFTYQNPAFFTTIPASLDTSSPARSTVYVKDADLRVPRTLISTVGLEHEFPRGVSALAQFLFSRGDHHLRLREASDASRRALVAAGVLPPVLQFESSGRSDQRELLLGLRLDRGSSNVYVNYQLGRRQSDTDAAYTTPADSTDLSGEYGAAADDRRHQIAGGATVHLPGGIAVDSAVTVVSGQPFNITTGRDTNGDTLFTERPSFASPGDTGAVQTTFGLFDPTPGAGGTIIPRNFGREAWQINVDLALTKELFAGFYVTADVENLLNASRLTGSNGVITSPVFGLPNRALSARRFELTLRYGF
jgi:hypothetical protein